MKIKNKLITISVCGAMLLACRPITADALGIGIAVPVTDLHAPAEGYEVIDPEFFEKYRDDIEETCNGIITHCHASRPYFADYYHFSFNSIVISTVDSEREEIAAVFDKYKDRLDMEYYFDAADLDYGTGEEISLVGSIPDTEGLTMEDLEAEYDAAAEKCDTIMAMCRELYKTGKVETIDYRLFTAGSHAISLDCITIRDYTGSYEVLEETVLSHSPASTLTVNDDGSYVVDTGNESSGTEYVNTVIAIDALEGEHSVELGLWRVQDEMGAPTASMGGGTADLAAIFENEETGDISYDGKTSILDIITLSKAASGIVSLNEERTVMADLNSDGTVDSGDVTLLMQYLVGLIDTI